MDLGEGEGGMREARDVAGDWPRLEITDAEFKGESRHEAKDVPQKSQY